MLNTLAINVELPCDDKKGDFPIGRIMGGVGYASILPSGAAESGVSRVLSTYHIVQ